MSRAVNQLASATGLRRRRARHQLSRIERAMDAMLDGGRDLA
jgi:hypothetical protein